MPLACWPLCALLLPPHATRAAHNPRRLIHFATAAKTTYAKPSGQKLRAPFQEERAVVSQDSGMSRERSARAYGLSQGRGTCADASVVRRQFEAPWAARWGPEATALAERHVCMFAWLPFAMYVLAAAFGVVRGTLTGGVEIVLMAALVCAVVGLFALWVRIRKDIAAAVARWYGKPVVRTIPYPLTPGSWDRLCRRKGIQPPVPAR